MFVQKLLPALAVIGVVAAQNRCTSTATIASQADADTYQSCKNLTSVIIAPGAAGVISINGPTEITGDITCENAGNLNTLGSTSIKKIGGAFNLFNVTKLSTLNWLALTEVNTIKWDSLPALSELTFPEEVSEAKSVQVTNTFLNDLAGINLNTVGTLNINNNNRLTTFSSQIGTISESLQIFANGRNLQVTFPNLIWAANISVRAVKSLRLDSLEVVNGSLGIYETFIESFSAPNLTSVGNFNTLQGGLAFVANEKLTNLTIPLLQTVGAQNQIANNTLLNKISFPALTSVGGAIDFSGNFSTPALPKLNDVRGGFNMQSKSQIDCSGFDTKHSNGDIQGVFTCVTTDNVQSGVGSAGDTSGTSSGSTNKTKDGAASAFGISSAAAGISFLGLVAMLF